METLLPSEVARLVLGYLQDNCEDAARIFLEQSSHLAECLELAKQGRKYTTKVMGNSLIDLLQEYCAVHCLVSERSQKLPENAAEQLKQSASLVQKLKFLIDASKSGQTFLLSITVPSQGSASQTGSTPASSGRSKSWLQCSSERAKRSGVRSQKSKEKDDKSVRRSSDNSVEATPLHSLPGLSPAGNCWNSSKDRADSNDDQADAPGCSPSSCSTPRRKGPPPRKKLSTSVSKLKKTHSEENDSNESVDIALLQQALLENKQLHEKIAENINRVMRIPSDGLSESQLPVAPPPESMPVPCDGMMNELDQAIKTIVHQTEQDPLFESFLEEILGPIEEEVSSSPAAGDCESDTEETGSGSPHPREAAAEEESLNTPRTSHSVDEESTPAPGEVPLKQRLRSARNRISDGSLPTPSTPSAHGNLSLRLAAESPENEAPSPATKEQRKKESLLEEQNAAAIQSIITANIEKTVDDRSKTDLEKEANINTDTQQLTGTHSTEIRDTKSAESQSVVNSHSANGEAESSVRDASVNPGQDYVTEISVPDNSIASEIAANSSSQQHVNYSGSKDIISGGIPSECQGPPGGVVRAITSHRNEGSAAVDSGAMFGSAASVTVPVSIQSSCIWEGLPVILTATPDSQGQKGGMPIVQPVHVPVTVERGRMVLAVERPATATVSPAPLAVSLADQHPTVATSSIILYSGDHSFQPFASTSQYQSPNFTTIDASQPLSIAPKGSKIAVRETQGTGENIVLRNLIKTDVVNKQEVAEAVDPALTGNKKNTKKKSSSSKKKAKKKSGSKKIVSAHEKKKTAVAAESSKKISTTLKKGNETTQKNENTLASESSIIVMEGTQGISLSIPDISYHDSHEFGVTKEVPLALDSRIQVASSINSVKSTESCSDIVFRHKSQEVVKDKDLSQVRNDTEVSTHLDANNSLQKPVSDAGINSVMCSNERPVDKDASGNIKQKSDTGDTARKPRQTPHVIGPDINKNTTEKSGSDCKPRQTPLVRRTSTVAGGRLSLSTPRRRTSHIRALDFGTPPKSVTDSLLKRRSNSAPKDTAHDANTSCSPDGSSDCRIQQAKNVRSSLFKSPDLLTTRQHSDMLTPTLTAPIATRTPTPKLSGDWERVTGAGLIFGNTSPLLMSPTREENNDLISAGQSITAPAGEDHNSDDRPSSPLEVVLESDDNQKNDSDKCETPASNQEGALAVWRKSILNYSKSKETKRRAWDADLRAIVAQDYEVSVKKSDVKKKTVKRNKKKVDKETEEEARLVESRLESLVEEIGNKQTEGGLPPEEDISVSVIDVEGGAVGKKTLDSTNESTENVPVTSESLEPKQNSDKSAVLLADTSTVPAKTSDNLEEKFATNSEKTVELEPEESCSASEQGGNSKFVHPKETSTKQSSRNRKRKVSGVVDGTPKKRQKIKHCTTGKEKKSKGKNTKGGNGDNASSLANDSDRGLGASSSLERNELNSEMDDSETDHTKTEANTKVSVLAAAVTDTTSIASSSESKDSRCVTIQSVSKEVNVMEAFISTAALETPQKVSPTNSIVGTGFQVPITPRIMSPSTLLDTPISNFLREQPSIDLSMIPTPNFPPTPNIAVTPHSAELNSPTSYASRPTDYSSCSSYYKPSHSPSRTLEQVLIDECNRIESADSPDRLEIKRSSAVCRKEIVESQEVCISITEEDGSVIQAEQQVTLVTYSSDPSRDMLTVRGDTQTTSKADVSGEAVVHSTDTEESDKKQTNEKINDSQILEEGSESATNHHHTAPVTSENSVTGSKQSIAASSSTDKECQYETINIVERGKEEEEEKEEEEQRRNDAEKLQSEKKNSRRKGSACNNTVKTAKILEIPVGQQDTPTHGATIKGSSKKHNITRSVVEPDIRTKRRISHSAIDLTVSSELEQKKNRMMAKLKGGTSDTVKGTKIKEVMKKDKRRKKTNQTIIEKEKNEKVLCEAVTTKETVTLEMSGVQNVGCEEPLLTEKDSVVIENVSTVIRSSEESLASKSVSATDHGTESLTATVTPQKGILLRRQGISVDIIAERLWMEAQNPQANRMAHSKESETKCFSESHLSAHVQGPPNGDDNDDNVIECTVRQPPHDVAQLSQEINTAEVTIGSQTEKSKSHKGCTVPNKRSVMEDENELVNSDEKKDCEVSHKGHGDSARTCSKKNGNSNETSMKPEAYNMTGVEEVGKEIATYPIENEVHSLQEVEEDNRSATNKKPEDVAHKTSGKEVNAKDHMSQRKKHESNRKSLNKEGAECNREKDSVSIKKSKKLAKENTKDQLTKSVVDNKSNELSNISGNMIVAEKCNVQDTPIDFSSVHQHYVMGRNERNDQGSQPLDVKGDHNKEQDTSKAKKSTKSRNESSNVCLAKSIVGNTVSEHDKIVGDPVIVEKVKVQDTLEKNSDTRHHYVPESEEKRSEVIQPLNMEGELVCADITTVKTCTELRKEGIEESFTRSTVDSIYHDLDNIPSKHRAVEQSEMQNTSKNIPDAQHLNVDSSENDVKDDEDQQPSFVSNNSADSSNMYVIIKYEGNGPRMQQKESEDFSDTTFTLMDEAGSHTLSVTGFFDLLSISPEKVSPRVLNRSTNEPDLTSKSATVPLVHEEERSVSHTKAGGSVSVQESLHLKHSSKKEHHSGHSGSKTSRERRREGQVKHTNSSYKHRIGDKSLKASESRASNKSKRLFQSPDKIMSKYRHGVKGSPRSSTFQRDRSVTPSRVPSRRPSTDGTKPGRLPLKSPRPPSKLSSSVTLESVIKRGTPVSRLKDMRHKSSHKRESVSQNPSKKCSSSGTQMEGETVKHKKEKWDLGHVRNSSDSMAVRDRRDTLQGAACSLLKKVREGASVTDSGDELMTYALIGSVREEDSNSSTQQQSNEAASRENWSDSHSSHAVATSSNEDLKILPPKKRKPSTEDGLAQRKSDLRL
ncbi:uncharacterized protein LOC126281191 isoform X2 [Schistocerca gregaria]|uniref:uncharacterized protein LOC126281191 isoform X2 n=1 Tax=Schistocerca gregaria TaxID=7010 RepID=UPI00211DCA49|nr:uncharacterized protein LOC126281191 isoform X2 [Schistocerca gregaria]